MRFFFNPLSGQVNAGPPREIVYADTAPEYPLEGSRWFDTINLREYVYDGAAWVETGVGPAGVKGDTGEKGDKGDIGPIGPVGPQGPAATIAVGIVTTGSAGTSASVSNSGTSGAAVFDFTIPQGAKGDTGDIGPQGPQGIQGVKGDDGASISLKGAVTSPADLTSIAVKVEGDLYVAQSDGNGYVWDGSTWLDVGQIRGPKGDTGPQGPVGPAPAGTGAVVVSNGVVGTPVGYGTANVANTLVQRDASGNFSAGTITGTFSGNVTGGVTGNVTGNASTASKLATAQTINVSGDVTGTAQSFDGSAAITIPTAISAGVIVNADINAAAAISDTKLATISTAGKVSNSATTATSANTANAIVARDANGNFTAGTITAALSGNAASASSAAKLTTARTINGTLFDGSADITITAAPTAHNHDASNITAGTLANDRLPARLKAAAYTITDWDNALENGWYQGVSAANAPEGVLDWWLGYVEAHYDRWVTQTVHRFTIDAPANTQVWRRSSADSGATVRTWGAWYKLQLSQGEQDARYALTAHTHDDRYYTETEVNTLLAGKAASAHTHDDRYYTETEVNTLLAGKQAAGSYAAAAHTHDDRYYTETEVNTLLAGKQAAGSYAAAGHTHGNITNAGAIGVTSGIPIITGTSGVLQAGSFGSTAGTFCQGDDSRLSNARTPTFHTHDADQITSGTLSNDRLYATSANAINNLVLRDASGNFSAGTITANLTGNASSATKLATARTISLTGGVTGSATFDGSGNVSIATTVAAGSGIPAGAVMPFAMVSVPTGWLAANGAAVVRAFYPELFNAIGTTYGAGDGNTTFNLPDLRGIFVRGSGSQVLFPRRPVSFQQWSRITREVLVNWANHALPVDTAVSFSGPNLPTGVTAGTTYYVRSANLTKNSFMISTVAGGASVLTDTSFASGIGRTTVFSVSSGGSDYNVGTLEHDTFQGHYHSTRAELRSFVGPGVGWDNWLRAPGTGSAGSNVAGPVSDGTNDTPRTSSETRPANIGMVYCIKF